MATSSFIPVDLAGITPGWLSDALARTHPGTGVGSVDVSDVIHGSLTKLRLRLGYNANPHALPDTVFVKAAFEDHGIPVSVRSEAVFYDVARPQVSVTSPAVFAALHDDEAGVVVMQDLDSAGATITDPTAPWSVGLVADGLRQLASLHARWWGDGRVAGIPDFEGSNALGAILMEAGYWEQCVAGPTGVHVPERFRDRQRTRPLIEGLWQLDTQLPLAFCHGDAHLGNTYVTVTGGAGFLDWGGVKAGHWAREVCYFLAGALSVADRRTHEEDLVRNYLTELARHGADPMPAWDDAWRSYRRHILHGLLWFLCPIQMQPVEVINANVERFATAATDHSIHRLF